MWLIVFYHSPLHDLLYFTTHGHVTFFTTNHKRIIVIYHSPLSDLFVLPLTTMWVIVFYHSPLCELLCFTTHRYVSYCILPLTAMRVIVFYHSPLCDLLYFTTHRKWVIVFYHSPLCELLCYTTHCYVIYIVFYHSPLCELLNMFYHSPLCVLLIVFYNSPLRDLYSVLPITAMWLIQCFTTDLFVCSAPAQFFLQYVQYSRQGFLCCVYVVECQTRPACEDVYHRACVLPHCVPHLSLDVWVLFM